MGMPIVVCEVVREMDTTQTRSEMPTYINSEVKEVEGARVRHVLVLSESRLVLLQALLRGDPEIPGREHRHEQVGQVQHHGPHNLLRSVESPNLDRASRPFAVALPHQR